MTTQANPLVALRALVLITSPRLATRAVELLGARAVPVQYQSYAQGTASSEVMDLLGLGEIDKGMVMAMMPKPIADDLMKRLRRELRLDTVNSGIAFTVPITGGNNLLLHLLRQMEDDADRNQERRGDTAMADMKYTMIAAVVNQGFSQEVMVAAREAGARGGTVLHSRRVVGQEAVQVWDGVQDEVEVVLILAPAESKRALMQSISSHCGVQSEARGIVLSLPIDSIIGLRELEEE